MPWYFAEYSGTKFYPVFNQSLDIAMECLKAMDPEIDEYVFSYLG